MDDYFQSSTGAPTRTAPVSGTPAAPYTPYTPYTPAAATPVAPAWPQQPAWGGQPAAASTSTGVKVLIVLACVVVGLVIMGILAAIAIPVFLDQRAKARAAAVHVSIPEQAAGMHRLHTSVAASVERELLSPKTPGTHYAAVYGVGSKVVASIGISTHPMRPGDRRAFLRGAEDGAAGDGRLQLGAFSIESPGALGGDLECAPVSSSGVMCFFADDGSYGVVTAAGSYAEGVDLARSLRGAVERRT